MDVNLRRGNTLMPEKRQYIRCDFFVNAGLVDHVAFKVRTRHKSLTLPLG